MTAQIFGDADRTMLQMELLQIACARGDISGVEVPGYSAPSVALFANRQSDHAGLALLIIDVNWMLLSLRRCCMFQRSTFATVTEVLASIIDNDEGGRYKRREG